MCGRFSIVTSTEMLRNRFHIHTIREPYIPRYNAAPGQRLPVIINENPLDLSFLRWGLVPFWAKDEKIGYKMINARAETIDSKPSYRTPFKKRRCLIPSDGFYEWDKKKKGKQPFHITLRSGALFSFAGLWDTWKTPEGEILQTFTIITTAPNQLLNGIHDRMPVILKQENEKAWLDQDTEKEELLSFLKPFPDGDMQMREVSPKVNSPANDDPSLWE